MLNASLVERKREKEMGGGGSWSVRWGVSEHMHLCICVYLYNNGGKGCLDLLVL